MTIKHWVCSRCGWPLDSGARCHACKRRRVLWLVVVFAAALAAVATAQNRIPIRDVEGILLDSCANGNLIKHGATTLECIATASVNVGTATALAANGANCAAGSYPLGVDASGAAESCTAAGGAGEEYITVGNTAGLSAERAITAGTGLTGTDGGANSTYTLDVIGFDESVKVNADSIAVRQWTAGDGLSATVNSPTGLEVVAGGNAGIGMIQGCADADVIAWDEANDYWECASAGAIDALTTQGDILFHNGTTSARLAAGTAGQALTTGGGGANPSWAGMTTQGDLEYRDGSSRARLAKGAQWQQLREGASGNAPEWGHYQQVLSADVSCAVSASYCEIFSITPATASVGFTMWGMLTVVSGSTTVAPQFRVSTLDPGTTGNCHWSCYDNAGVDEDVMAIASGPADTADSSWGSTAATTVEFRCALDIDGSPAAIAVEFQLETGTTPTQYVRRGSWVMWAQ